MNVNFGLFPPLGEAPRSETGKKLRGTEKSQANKRAMSLRAERDLEQWLGEGRPFSCERETMPEPSQVG